MKQMLKRSKFKFLEMYSIIKELVYSYILKKTLIVKQTF